MEEWKTFCGAMVPSFSWLSKKSSFICLRSEKHIFQQATPYFWQLVSQHLVFTFIKTKQSTSGFTDLPWTSHFKSLQLWTDYIFTHVEQWYKQTHFLQSVFCNVRFRRPHGFDIKPATLTAQGISPHQSTAVSPAINHITKYIPSNVQELLWHEVVDMSNWKENYSCELNSRWWCCCAHFLTTNLKEHTMQNFTNYCFKQVTN